MVHFLALTLHSPTVYLAILDDTITDIFYLQYLLIRLLLAFFAKNRRATINRLLFQGLLDLLLLESVDLLDPVLHLLSFILQPQVELPLQLHGLLFLSLALGHLGIVPLQLRDHLLLLQLQLAVITLDLFRALQLLVSLLFIVDLPGLLHVPILLLNAFSGHQLLLFEVLEEFVVVQLLDL